MKDEPRIPRFITLAYLSGIAQRACTHLRWMREDPSFDQLVKARLLFKAGDVAASRLMQQIIEEKKEIEELSARNAQAAIERNSQYEPPEDDGALGRKKIN